MADLGMLFSMKLKKLIGDTSELPFAGTVVDNINGAIGSGFLEIASSLPATIAPTVTAVTATVSITGNSSVSRTLVSKTKNVFDLPNAIPVVSNVTKTNFLTGFQLTGPSIDSSWFNRYVGYTVALEPNTQYTLSALASTNDDDKLASGAIVYENGNTSNILGQSRSTNNINTTFTTTSSGVIDLRFYLSNGASAINPIITSYYDIIIAKGGSVVPYAEYFNETHTIPPFSLGYSQVVNIVPRCEISNPEGVFTTNVKVQISISDSVKQVNGQSPDSNGAVYVPKSLIDGKKFVCFGDSITEFGTYPEQIADITGATTYNVGFGGCWWGQHPDSNYQKFCMYSLADAIFNNNFTAQDTANTNLIALGDDNSVNLNRLKGIDWSTIDAITIFYGTNDFGGNEAAGTTSDLTPTTFYGAINYALQKLLNKYPKIKIYLITPIYRQTFPAGTNSDLVANTQGLYLRDYSNKIIEMGQKYHLPVLNLYDTSGINQYNQAAYLTSDGTHPTLDGYSLLARNIAKFLTTY